jgi:hypothetical protein
MVTFDEVNEGRDKLCLERFVDSHVTAIVNVSINGNDQVRNKDQWEWIVVTLQMQLNRLKAPRIC